MASVFSKEEAQERTVLEIVRDSLDVDGEGTVRFRTRTGRGSGKAVEIPGTQFDEFVTLLVQTRESREALATQQRELEQRQATQTPVTNSESNSESDSE